ncbi:hypothetical protein GCM10010129_74630 [Streptomyces fumigatiscleroticus]|nr:hypothetical protein GCM10010129_74630 [Streptomyces fumigatiscleroticus]
MKPHPVQERRSLLAGGGAGRGSAAAGVSSVVISFLARPRSGNRQACPARPGWCTAAMFTQTSTAAKGGVTCYVYVNIRWRHVYTAPTTTVKGPLGEPWRGQ